MTSPCGKCNTCPCGTSGGAPPPQQPSHRSPPPYSQQPQQQPEPCGYTSQGQTGCQVTSTHQQQQQQYQPQQQNQGQVPHSCAGHAVQGPQARTVHRECTCTQNRVRNAPPTVHVDHVTCSRGPAEQPIMETRCNCHEQQQQQHAASKQVECTCTPPVVTAAQACPPTHANVYCGQSPKYGPVPYQRPTKEQGPCGHCRAQNPNHNKKKKCVIQ